MSETVPDSLKAYFGHDKVALFGSGGMPAAPPAPPGSPARRQGEAALADALSKVGTPGPRPGSKPAVIPPKHGMSTRMRKLGERALFEASMSEFSRRRAARGPHHGANLLFRKAFTPLYRRIPWNLKRRMVQLTSGVRGWRT
jgi:hypothetical protein